MSVFPENIAKLGWILLVVIGCILPHKSFSKNTDMKNMVRGQDKAYGRASSGLYLVIGSFRSFARAKKLNAKYYHLRPRILLAEVRGTEYFRVAIGPVNQSERLSLINALDSLGIKDSWSIQINPGNNSFIVQNIENTVKKSIMSNHAKNTIPKNKNQSSNKNLSSFPADAMSEKKKQNADFKDSFGLVPGDVFADCVKCPELVVIPAGGFIFGKKNSKVGPDNINIEVFIPDAFAMGRFEVTVEEWNKCAALGECSSYIPETKEWGLTRNPVTNISWHDSIEYTEWLSRLTGKKYRLPSEAEWEYAAKAGSNSKYWWGEDLGINKAVCQECGSLFDGKIVAPVGTFSPNSFGLYDTAGNLWEWTQDCYQQNAYKNHKEYPSPVTGDFGCSRVLRGGAWDAIAAGVETSFRFASGGANRSNVFGFRVVREIEK